MKIAKYWHKEQKSITDPNGKVYDLVAWGGSSESLDDAKTHALDKLKKWIDKIQYQREAQHQYEYGRGELKEEILDSVYDSKGRLIAAITRNRYGAEILNTAAILIADIDEPKKSTGFFQKLFGKSQKLHQQFVDNTIKKIQMIIDADPDVNARLYATKAGLRVFFTHKEYEPNSEVAEKILQSLGADELYRTLCSNQSCYRARLTPKPWRCGYTLPPVDFPRETQEKQAVFATWLKGYNNACTNYSVCRFIQSMGSGKSCETADKIIDLHDKMTIKTGITEKA